FFFPRMSFSTLFIPCCSCFFFFALLSRPPSSTFFPYTTLFRSYFECHGYPLQHQAPYLIVFVGPYIIPVKLHLHCNKPSAHFLRSEEHTSELQSRFDLVCRLLLEKKKIRREKRHCK